MSIIEIPGNDLVDPPVRAIGWAQFKTEVLERYRPPMCVAQTRAGMVRMFRELAALEPPPASTADLTVGLVARILAARADREESPRTKIGLLRHVSCAATIAVESGWLTRSPFSVRPIRRWVRAGKPTGRRHLTRQELATLLGHQERAAAEAPAGWSRWKAHRIYAMTAVDVYTGLRRGELEHLDVADVDLERRIIHVRPKARHRLKTESSADVVPMPRALVPIVGGWLEHRLDPPVFPPADRVPWLFPGSRGIGPWTGGSCGSRTLDALQASACAAGIDHIDWQMLRRGLATHLRAFGVSGAMASQVLRHSESVDLAYYLQDDEDNLRRAVEDVEF